MILMFKLTIIQNFPQNEFTGNFLNYQGRICPLWKWFNPPLKSIYLSGGSRTSIQSPLSMLSAPLSSRSSRALSSSPSSFTRSLTSCRNVRVFSYTTNTTVS